MTDEGRRRLEALDERAVHTATELQAMSDEELPEQTRIRGESFDHREWMEAELSETMDERERTLDVVTVQGGATYENDR